MVAATSAAVGAVLTPFQYFARGRTANERAPSMSIYIPAWQQSHFAAKSDAEGKFQLPIPTGYEASFRLDAPNFGTTEWTAEIGAELAIALAKPGTVRVMGPAELKGQKISIAAIGNTKSKTPAVVLVRSYASTFDDRGTASFEHVVPGSVRRRPT